MATKLITVLSGYINYEGTGLLGVYTSRAEAIAAMEAFRDSDENRFDQFLIEWRELDAPADPDLLTDDCREWFPGKRG